MSLIEKQMVEVIEHVGGGERTGMYTPLGMTREGLRGEGDVGIVVHCCPACVFLTQIWVGVCG